MEPLGDICDFVNGGPWSETEYADAGIRVVKVSNMQDGTIVPRADDDYLPDSKYTQYKKHELRAGDIVVAMVGSHPTQLGSVVGRTALIPRFHAGSFLNQNAVCLRVRRARRHSQRYLFYLSKTVLFSHHIESRARGSANQVRMAVSELKKFKSTFPRIEVQRKIAAILSVYDELIENNKRRIALLKNVTEEIYREWFGRLRFPGHETVQIIKRVPRGWREAKLAELIPEFGLQTGKRPPGGAQEFGIPSIGAENVTGLAQHDFSKEKYVSENFFDAMRQGHVADKDILFYKDGAEIGRVTLAQDGFPHEKCAVNEHVFLIRTHELSAQYFLFFYLSQPAIQEYVKTINKNAAQPGINKTELRSIPIVLPPIDLITEFERLVSPNIRQIFTLANATRVLTETRGLLLPRLIAGKLAVEDLDIQFPPGMAEELNDAPATTVDA